MVPGEVFVCNCNFAQLSKPGLFILCPITLIIRFILKYRIPVGEICKILISAWIINHMPGKSVGWNHLSIPKLQRCKHDYRTDTILVLLCQWFPSFVRFKIYLSSEFVELSAIKYRLLITLLASNEGESARIYINRNEQKGASNYAVM